MKCQRCNSVRIVEISGKCSDCFGMWADGKEYLGYVPDDMNIGGGDEVEFKYCLECGQIQAQFPLPDPTQYFEPDEEEVEEERPYNDSWDLRNEPFSNSWRS